MLIQIIANTNEIINNNVKNHVAMLLFDFGFSHFYVFFYAAIAKERIVWHNISNIFISEVHYAN